MNARPVGVVVAVALTLAPLPAAADGGVALGVTTLLQSGDPADKVDLTFLGDGFTREQQAKFDEKVDDVVRRLMRTHPFFSLRSAFNIHRVNVASPESGTDKFAKCGDDEVQDDDELKETALDTGFCTGGTGGVDRCVVSSDPAEVHAFAAASPDDEHVIVLINDSKWGGCASGGIGYSTLADGFEDMFVHELGHSLFGLADEYEYDAEGTYSGPEPGAVDITTRTTRETLIKWNDLILDSTAVPTDDDQDCDEENGTAPDFAVDLVGAYEGASHRRCGLYRPQPDCMMRHSGTAFCSVCRRKIIRDLVEFLNTDRTVTLTNLLIRDDHDPWGSGSGDIYLEYELETGLEIQEGRVPSDGEFSMDSGDSRDLSHTLGLLRTEGPGGAPDTVALRVRDEDTIWDDEIEDDHVHTFTGVGAFEVDEDEWRLRGEVLDAPLMALFDAVGVNDDHEPWISGDADVYVNYTVTNGAQTVTGRWPASGDAGIAEGEGRSTGVFMAALPEPAEGETLRVTFLVRDADAGDDDTLGEETFEFTAADLFGTQQVTHQREADDSRVTFSLFRAAAPPPGQFGRGPDLLPEPLTPGNNNPFALCRRTDAGLVVRVRNQGSDATTVPTTTLIQFAAGDQTATTPPLGSGAFVDHTFPVPAGCFSPDCGFTIRVDADNAVAEPGVNASDTSHEGNNIAVGRCLG